VVLNLKSNPSTGYSWVQADTKTPVLVVVLGKPAYKRVAQLPGAGVWSLGDSGRWSAGRFQSHFKISGCVAKPYASQTFVWTASNYEPDKLH
jgi:hypothetical protein